MSEWIDEGKWREVDRSVGYLGGGINKTQWLRLLIRGKVVVQNESQISGLSSQTDNGVTYRERRHCGSRGGKSGIWARDGL